MVQENQSPSETPHKCVVLECSQVETPSQFWDAYVAQIPMEGTDCFGRNLDALWDGLSAGGPGWPGPVWVEVHAVERLAAHGDGSFVQALEALGRELAEQNADARLSVIRRAPRPSGRLYQHERLRSRELTGKTIESAIRWQSRPNTCALLWVKPHGMYWQRFFLDAGFAVWEEWPDSDIEDEFDELRDELVAVDELRDQVIAMVEFDGADGGTPEIRFKLGSGSVVCIVPLNPFDFDSNSTLEVRFSEGL